MKKQSFNFQSKWVKEKTKRLKKQSEIFGFLGWNESEMFMEYKYRLSQKFFRIA